MASRVVPYLLNFSVDGIPRYRKLSRWCLRHLDFVLLAQGWYLHVAVVDDETGQLTCHHTFGLPFFTYIEAIFCSNGQVCVLYTVDSIYYLATWTIESGFGVGFSTGIRKIHYPMQVVHGVGPASAGITSTETASIVLFDEGKKPVQFEHDGTSFRRSEGCSLSACFNIDMKIELSGSPVSVFSYSIHVGGKVYFFKEDTVYELNLALYEMGVSQPIVRQGEILITG